MKFDNKAMQRLYEDVKDAMEAVKQGKSAAQAASELYVRGLPDKDQQLGDVMAERVEEIVSQYEKLAKDALADPDGWIDAQLDRLGENGTRTERCRLLLQMLEGVTAVNASLTGEEVRAMREQSMELDERRVNEETERELREALKEALAASTLGAVQLEALGEALESLPPEQLEEGVIEFGRDAHGRKVLLAMTAYVNAKNGTLEDVPAEATIEEITTAVCLADDTVCVCAGAQSGAVSEEEAPRILQILGRVAAFYLIGNSVAFIMSGGLEILTGAGSLCTGLVIPVGIMLTIVLGAFVMSMGDSKLDETITNGAWRLGKKAVAWVKQKAQSMRDRRKEKQQAEQAAARYAQVQQNCCRRRTAAQQSVEV